MKVVTSDQMVTLERASELQGVSTDELMENAGLAVARVAREVLNGVAGVRVAVLVGPGNNGADGLVTARHLRRWGAEVSAYVVTSRPGSDPKMDLARDYGVTIHARDQDPELVILDRLLSGTRLVIDAVLGTGRSRPLEGAIKEVVSRLGPCRKGPRRATLLALDLPTGLDADTGQVDPACATADLTVALGRPKVGLLTFPGVERVGQLRVVDIGLPAGLAEEERITLELLTPEWVRGHLPARPLDSHKGNFGHALVVAGSRNYVGAAYLASQAAVRVGTGLVTLATPQSVYSIAAAKLTEVIHQPLPEDAEGRVHPDAAEWLRCILDRYTSLSVGCGLGQSTGTTAFLEQLLLSDSVPQIPTVIDADGLNCLSQLPAWWERLGGPAAVTPHPGEMATLTGTATADLLRDRVASAKEWAARWNVNVVLKGACTIIAEPEGLARISPFANPGLASGGTGDVLTGIIGGLMAQGLSPGKAAACGVYLHGRAAEAVGQRLGNTGTVASDLIECLPETINRVRSGGGR